METVYFVLGVVSVLLVLGVGVIVKVGLLVRELREKLRNIEMNMDNEFNIIYRSIEEETKDLQSQLDSRLDELEKEVFSQMDSRLDKLENKLTTKK
jgi:hypothetical protein